MSESTALVFVPAAAPIAELTPAQRLYAAWLSGRSPQTLRAYRQDVADFATFLGLDGPEPATLHLLSLAAGPANELVLGYRSHLSSLGRSPATINRRLAALRSLVKLGRTLGLVTWSIEIGGAKAEAYRDTAGPGEDAYRKMLAHAVARKDPKGLRDVAIVRLLHDRGLRRGEVAQLDLDDFDPAGGLQVLGKGRQQKDRLGIPRPTTGAVLAWLGAREAIRTSCPALFLSLDTCSRGQRLTGHSIYRIVQAIGKAVGVSCRPHKLRHQAITTALEKTNGDVRTVMRFSRHKRLDTLMIYDDRRRDDAADIARIVAGE